ncbi:hypothetical protein CISIN_1g0109161mg, partial [Citrus sinensis]
MDDNLISPKLQSCK